MLRSFLLLLLASLPGGQGFAPLRAVTTASRHLRGPTTTTKLEYRPHNAEDDESAMLKVSIRAPPFFDMKQAMSQEAERQAKKKKKSSALNKRLIFALLLNQVLILGLASAAWAIALAVFAGPSAFQNLNTVLNWSGSTAAPFSIWDFALTPKRVLQGIAGALPLLAVSGWVEASDKRAFAQINFSTISMALTLFGQRQVPPPELLPKDQQQQAAQDIPTTTSTDAAAQSALLSMVTGICEELVFRRQVASLLALYFGAANVGTVLVAQAALFALGHAQGKVSSAENAIVLGLQLFNGLGFGLIYLLTGGDIVPCILAHALYDFVTFFKTWVDANNQVEYANAMYTTPLPADVERQVRAATAKPLEPSLFRKIRRLFYLFDFDKNKTLSLSEVRKGVAYTVLERAGVPPPTAQVDQLFRYAVANRSPDIDCPSDRLTFPDFVRMFSMMQSPQRGQGQ